MEKTIYRRQSFFSTGFKVQKREIWNSYSHLGTIKRKPVPQGSLEESQGSQEQEWGGVGGQREREGPEGIT